MGFFDKVKKMAGFDGVRIDLAVPLVIPKNDKVISGKVFLACKEGQAFQWIKVELQREERTTSYSSSNSHHSGNDTTTSWVTVSDYVMDEPFTMVAGEEREFDFQMVSSGTTAGGPVDSMQEMGGFLGGLGNVLDKMNLDPDYRIEAKANVDGVVFDPTKSVGVAFE